MRIVSALLLILAAAPIGAECLISNCSGLEVTDSSVLLHCEIDSTGTNVDLVRIGRFTAGVANSEGTQDDGRNPGASAQAWGIYSNDFVAGSTREVFPQYSTDGGSTWSTPATDEGSGNTCGQNICPNGAGAQPGGYSCDANNMIQVTLDAAPSPGPVVAPNPPVHTNTGEVPAITGNTYTISDCTEVQSKFVEARDQANIDDLVHEVAWAVTGVCHPGLFATPALSLDLCGVTTTTGGVVWTGGMPDADLDRHGARPEADFWGHGPTLTYDPAEWQPRQSLILSSCATRRVFFAGTYSIGTPSRDAIVAAQPADAPFTAAAPSGFDQIDFTVGGGTGLPNQNNLKMRVHAPGVHNRLASWGGFYHAIDDGAKIRTGLANMVGSWTGGGGVMRQRIKPFTATATTEPVLTMDHLLGDGFPFPIDNITSDVLTTTGSHTITYNFSKVAFMIDGCGAADGVNYATAGSSTTLTLGRSVSDCTGGTVRRLELVQLSNLSGINTNALSCIFTVNSPTTIQLLECTDGQTAGVADWSAGSSITGDASFDPTPYPPPLKLDNASDSSFSGFIVRGNQAGQPWATMFDGALVNDPNAENLALTESFFDATHLVRAVNPVTGLANETTHNDIYVSAAVNANQAPGFYIRSIDSFLCGFLVFEETFSDIAVLTDFSLISSRQIYDERFMGGGANSNGFACQVRQAVELKPGAWRWALVGNTFWHMPVIGTNTNAAISAIRSSNGVNSEANGHPWGIQDGIIDSNFGTGRLFLSNGLYAASGSEYERVLAPERFRIKNNLWFTREGFHSEPCEERLFIASGCYGEVHSGLGTIKEANNLEISNNTIGLRQTTTGTYSYLLEKSRSRSAATLISKNVHILSHEGLRDMRCEGVNSWASCETVWTEEGAASSRFVMEDTTLIPCTLTPTDTDWNADNAAFSDVSGAWPDWPEGKKPTIIPGAADGQNCWQRILLAFNEDWSRKAALDGGGHDHAALMAAQGRPIIPDDLLEFDSDNHLARMVGYVAPNDGACNLCARPAADDRGDMSGLCAEDSGARTSRSVEGLDLTTLTGQPIKLELLCEQSVIHHWQGVAP